MWRVCWNQDPGPTIYKAPYNQVRLRDATVHLAESVTSQTPVRILEDRCAAACSIHFLNKIMGCVTHWSWLISLVFLLVSRSTLASYSTIRVLSAAYKMATFYVPTSVLLVFPFPSIFTNTCYLYFLVASLVDVYRDLLVFVIGVCGGGSIHIWLQLSMESGRNVDPLKLVLQLVVSFPMWATGAVLQSCMRTAPGRWAVSSAFFVVFKLVPSFSSIFSKPRHKIANSEYFDVWLRHKY